MWIACKDKMPEDKEGARYLVYSIHGNPPEVPYFYTIESGRYENWHGRRALFGREGGKSTHWMELPAAPPSQEK